MPDLLSKVGPTHPTARLERPTPEFRKAGAAAWLALNARTSVPCTQCTESGALLGSPNHLCKRFPYAKPGDLRKACRVPASVPVRSLEAATVEATKIRVKHPVLDISTLETVPKESLPVKKATEKEPAAPAVDSTI
ncbi:hypothetical protein BASA81_002886 [Batrachochytrium salamandrivorans]|nr:hypothetical protein BASA81_002886 [Batrachochytrium salamandrivorans]